MKTLGQPSSLQQKRPWNPRIPEEDRRTHVQEMKMEMKSASDES